MHYISLTTISLIFKAFFALIDTYRNNVDVYLLMHCCMFDSMAAVEPHLEQFNECKKSLGVAFYIFWTIFIELHVAYPKNP